MSTDSKATKSVMTAAADGRDGYRSAAERLTQSDAPELAAVFARYSDQREEFHSELERMAAAYGDNIDEDGSVAAAVHRGWMAVKDAVKGSSPEGVLDVASGGEAHAVGVYEDALGEDISADLRSLLEDQLAEIRAAQAHVAQLRASFN